MDFISHPDGLDLDQSRLVSVYAIFLGSESAFEMESDNPYVPQVSNVRCILKLSTDTARLSGNADDDDGYYMYGKDNLTPDGSELLAGLKEATGSESVAILTVVEETMSTTLEGEIQ